MQKTMGKYRWTICALLFFATTINYLDRSIIGVLKPTLKVIFLTGQTEYCYIVMAFMFLCIGNAYSWGELLTEWEPVLDMLFQQLPGVFLADACLHHWK